MALVALRWLGTVALLIVFAHRQVRRDWPLLKTRLPFLALMGGLGFTAFNALFYVAAHSTTAVNIGILQGSIPAFVLIGVFATDGARVSRWQLAGVAVTLLGVVLVGVGGDLDALTTLVVNRGDLLMVAACVLYAAYTVGLRRRPAVSSMSLFTVLAIAALAAALPLAAFEAASGGFQAPTARGWIIILLVTVFPSFLGQIFFIQGVDLIGPARAGVFVNLVPVFAAVLAVAYLREPFEPYHAMALGLVLGGIYLSERAARR